MKKIFSYILLIITCFLTINNVFATNDDNISLTYITHGITVTSPIYNDDEMVYKLSSNVKDIVGTWYYDDSLNSITISHTSGDDYKLTIVENNKTYKDITATIKNDKGTFRIDNTQGEISYGPLEDVNVLINLPKNESYGLVADLGIDEEGLKFKSCIGLNGFNVESDGKRIVIDSPVAESSKPVALCVFKKVKEEFGEIKLRNVQTSFDSGAKYINSVKINTQGEVSYFVEKGTNTLPELAVGIKASQETVVNPETTTANSETVKNPKTGVYDFSVLLIVIGGLTYVSYKYQKNGKFFKRITVLMILLLPISVFAKNISEINADINLVKSIREHLLNKGGFAKEKSLDLDEDGYVTINDLTYAVISYYTPKATISEIDSDAGTKVDDIQIYSKLSKLIETDTVGKTSIVSFCLTNEERCIPNRMLCAAEGVLTSEERKNYKDLVESETCDMIAVDIMDTTKSEKLCVLVTNDKGVSSLTCDDEKFIVDSKKPVITANSVTLQTLEEIKNYSYKDNMNVEFGIAKGKIDCEDNLDETHKVRTIECVATGNNGLKSDKKTFSISTSPTAGKNIVFYGDSIIDGVIVSTGVNGKNGFSIPFANYDFANVVNAGSSGCTISNDGCLQNSINAHIKDTQGINFDYVVIQGGINDAMGDWGGRGEMTERRDTSIRNTDFKSAAEKYVKRAKELHPNAHIIFLGTYGIRSTGGRNYMGDEYTGDSGYYTLMNYQNEFYSAYERVIPVEDRMSFSMDNYTNYLVDEWHLPDGLHCDDSAYMKMGTDLYNAIYNRFKTN